MKTQYVAGLYCRLSKDDERVGESVSIGTQRAILTEFCLQNNYGIFKVYVDDGYSGLNFERPAFQELLRDVEAGLVNMVVTKDLSRLGRDYIMTGYYSEVFFQTKGVRYIALADNVDSLYGVNEIAPFKNILNDMYARDVSRKVSQAKQQYARQGRPVGSQAPFGYIIDEPREQFLVDSEAAETVKMIFQLGAKGLGSVAIAKELSAQKYLTPSAYKVQKGDTRFQRYVSSPNSPQRYFEWKPATVTQILSNRVYLGELISLKTETLNYKTGQRRQVPDDRQIITPHAHEAIISEELFSLVHQLRKQHRCPFDNNRDNLFRGKLYCSCCGHPLSIAKKHLKDRTADLYQCMHHYNHPEVCPETHRIYHDVLYPYVLKQVQKYYRSTIRRTRYKPRIDTLTPELLDAVIAKIEIAHMKKTSKLGSSIYIIWK